MILEWLNIEDDNLDGLKVGRKYLVANKAWGGDDCVRYAYFGEDGVFYCAVDTDDYAPQPTHVFIYPEFKGN